MQRMSRTPGDRLDHQTRVSSLLYLHDDLVRQSRFQMDDDGDLHEQILHIEAHIEQLTDVIERCRKIILMSKAAVAVGGTLIFGNNHRSGQLRSYGHDWGDCGCYRRDGRFWVKHEYFDANQHRRESRRGTQGRVDQQNASSGGERRAGRELKRRGINRQDAPRRRVPAYRRPHRRAMLCGRCERNSLAFTTKLASKPTARPRTCSSDPAFRASARHGTDIVEGAIGEIVDDMRTAPYSRLALQRLLPHSTNEVHLDRGSLGFCRGLFGIRQVDRGLVKAAEESLPTA